MRQGSQCNRDTAIVRNLRIYEHLTTQDIESRFFTGRDDYLHAFEHINYALAVKKGR